MGQKTTFSKPFLELRDLITLLRARGLDAEQMFDLFLSAYRSKTIPILRESICGANVLLLDAAGHMTKGSVFQQELLIIVNEFLSSSKQVVLATEKPLSATDGSYHSRRLLARILSHCEVLQ